MERGSHRTPDTHTYPFEPQVHMGAELVRRRDQSRVKDTNVQTRTMCTSNIVFDIRGKYTSFAAKENGKRNGMDGGSLMALS